jgi:hypothetical protein
MVCCHLPASPSQNRSTSAVTRRCHMDRRLRSAWVRRTGMANRATRREGMNTRGPFCLSGALNRRGICSSSLYSPDPDATTCTRAVAAGTLVHERFAGCMPSHTWASMGRSIHPHGVVNLGPRSSNRTGCSSLELGDLVVTRAGPGLLRCIL